jgi:hypothetical protein
MNKRLFVGNENLVRLKLWMKREWFGYVEAVS